MSLNLFVDYSIIFPFSSAILWIKFIPTSFFMRRLEYEGELYRFDLIEGANERRIFEKVA